MYKTGLLILFAFQIVMIFRTNNYVRPLLYGFTFGVFALILRDYALADYWSPVYTFGAGEDFFYGLLIGMLAGSTEEELDERVTSEKMLNIVMLLVISVITLVAMLNTGFNSIVAHIVPVVAVGSFVTYKSGLTLKRLGNGFRLAGITAVTYLIWVYVFGLDLDSTFKIGNPIVYELLFAYVLGFATSGLYNIVQMEDEIVAIFRMFIKSVVKSRDYIKVSFSREMVEVRSDRRKR